MASTVGVKNPYRYRGYRYDTETGMYYCQSRYYSPEWGRWLNADTMAGFTGELLSHNMFAYCMNNPVNAYDPDGDVAWWIIGGAIGAVVGGVAGAVISYKKNGNVDWRYVAGGAAAGALVGAGAGALASAAYTGIVGAGASVASGGTIVIGQNMSRVIDKAQKIGAEVYSGLKYYSKLQGMFGEKVANFIGKADNALWIIKKMSKNYKIVDIGIDTNKALGNSSYILESILTYFYKNKEIAQEYFKGVF